MLRKITICRGDDACRAKVSNVMGQVAQRFSRWAQHTACCSELSYWKLVRQHDSALGPACALSHQRHKNVARLPRFPRLPKKDLRPGSFAGCWCFSWVLNEILWHFCRPWNWAPLGTRNRMNRRSPFSGVPDGMARALV
jgi:hypothetical protein